MDNNDRTNQNEPVNEIDNGQINQNESVKGMENDNSKLSESELANGMKNDSSKPRENESEVIDLNQDDEAESENADSEGKSKKKWSLPNLALLLVGIAMIGFAAFRIGSMMLNYNQSNKEYDEIAESFVKINSGESTGTEGSASGDGEGSSQNWTTKETTVWYEMVSVDLTSLHKKYSDVIAWLYQEGDTTISYPVMYSGDNSSYLHTTYKGTYAYAGSIFMEGVNNPDFNDAHTIIYGHNMRNGSMFGTLRYLQTKENYLDDHGYFQIFLEDEIRRYQVFSYEIVEETSWLYEIPSLGSEEYTTLIDKIRNASGINVDVEVTNEDKIITLSTCYGSNTTKRFVVQGVLVDTYYYDTGMTQSALDAQAQALAAEEAATEEPQEEEELEFLAQ